MHSPVSFKQAEGFSVLSYELQLAVAHLLLQFRAASSKPWEAVAFIVYKTLNKAAIFCYYSYYELASCETPC